MQREYFETCPYCEAHLDPGEHCDCLEAVKERENGGEQDER